MQKTILIIEDDTFILGIIARRFRENDFKILQAKDATEAETILVATPPDIILLDIILPKVNGFDILKRIKADPKTKPIPVVVFSNLGGKEDIKQAMDLGAADYLVKANFFPDEVVNKITNILSK